MGTLRSTASTRKTEPGMQYRVRRMSAIRGFGSRGVVGSREIIELVLFVAFSEEEEGEEDGSGLGFGIG